MSLAWIHPVMITTSLCLLACGERASSDAHEHEHEALAAEVRELREGVAELSREVDALRTESKTAQPSVVATARLDPSGPSTADPSDTKTVAELLASPAKPLPVEPLATSDGAADTTTAKPVEGIACEAGRCRVPTRLRDRFLKDPTPFVTQARVVPSMHEGQFDGLKLYAIREGSIFAALGFRNGDRVVTLAGKSLDAVADLMDVYARLEQTTELPVRLVRNGELYELVIELRD